MVCRVLSGGGTKGGDGGRGGARRIRRRSAGRDRQIRLRVRQRRGDLMSFATRWDVRLIGAAAAITFAGLIAMASAASTLNPGLASRHGVYAALGLVIFLGVSRTPYRRWTDFSAAIYGVSLFALLAVLLVGTMRLGATRWLSLFGLI